MSVRRIKAGSTDVSVTLRIVDSTDGTPETGVVFNTSGIDLWYRREGAASVDITEATLAALTTAHTDGGFLHINDGWYRLDLPDAACATGVAGVQIGGTVTGMVVLAPYIELDVNTAEDVYTRIGAPAGASVSADIADIEGKVDDLESRLGTPSDLGSGATVAANLVDIESQTDDIGVAGAGLTNINLPDQTMNITGNITGNLSGSVGSVTGAVGSVTGNVGGDVAGSVASVTAAVTVGTNNDKTGYRLSATGVDDVLDEAVEGTTTLRQMCRGFFAALLGISSGHESGAPKYRDIADTKDRIDATTDANGNRTAVTTDLT